MTICAYCKDEGISVGLSGMKQLENGPMTYNLCKDCCNNLKRISVYRPDELNKRQQFWEKVEDYLSETATE